MLESERQGISTPHWTSIIICDPRDKRGVPHTYDEIRHFHRSFKDLKTGEILSPEEAQARLLCGETGIARPWKEAGFHWAVAKGASGEPEVVMLRPMTQNGAYAREQNLNRSGIGVLVEDFSEPFLERLTTLCRFLIKTYKISPARIFGRWERNPAKPQPDDFNAETFRQRVQISMLDGLLHNLPSAPEDAD